MIFDELWWLERQLTARQRERSRALNRLRQKPGSRGIAIMDEMEKPFWERTGWEIASLRDEVERLKASRLIRRANRLGLPVPVFNAREPIENDTWERTSTGSYHLSRSAQANLRKEIRAEEKELRESKVYWVKDFIVPVLSLLIALLGATAAVLSVMRK